MGFCKQTYYFYLLLAIEDTRTFYGANYFSVANFISITLIPLKIKMEFTKHDQ